MHEVDRLGLEEFGCPTGVVEMAENVIPHEDEPILEW
jgi:hypothetical protein